MNELLSPSLGLNGHWNKAVVRRQRTWPDVERLICPSSRPPCPYECLPPIAEKAFHELKRNTGAPDAVILVMLVNAMAAAAMRLIRVKAPNWEVDVVSLFTITATEVGNGKSPVSKALALPFNEYDAARIANREVLAVGHESEMEAWKAIKKGLTDSLAKLSKSPHCEDAEKVEKAAFKLKQHVRSKPVMPQAGRLLKTNLSIASLLESLAGTDKALLLAVDDGDKFLSDMMVDPGNFTQLFDGSVIVRERRNQELVIVNPSVCLRVSTQPGRLMRFIKAHGSEAVMFGLLARFLIAVEWDEDWEGVDPGGECDWRYVTAFNEMVAKYLWLPDRLGSEDKFEPRVLPYDGKAAERFKDIQEELKALKRPTAALHGIKEFVRKAPQHINRTAAVFTLFTDETEASVSDKPLTQASHFIAWHLLQANELIVNKPRRESLKKVFERLQFCLFSHHHFNYAKIKNPAWIPKTYLLRFLHMEAGVLDPLLAIFEEHGFVQLNSHRGMVYVEINTHHF